MRSNVILQYVKQDYSMTDSDGEALLPTSGKWDTIMDIKMDVKQLIKDIIREEVGNYGSNVNQVKGAIKNEIQKHRSGLKSAEETIKKDFQQCRSDVQVVADKKDFAECTDSLIVNPAEYIIRTWGILRPYEFFPVLIIVWHLLYFVLKACYASCIFFRKYLGVKRTEVSFGNIEHAYIDRKYVACCLEFWLQEVTNIFGRNRTGNLLTENFNHGVVQDLLNSLDTIQNLSQIPKPFDRLKFHKLLMKNRGIGGNNEKTIIRKFKGTCLEQIIAYSESFQIESDFLRVFIDFLRASENTQVIIARLELVSFCSGDLPFNEVVEGILNLEVNAHGIEVTYLQETAKHLKGEKKPFLIKTFREVISSYIKPVEIKEKTLDGRLIIEAMGKIIVLSKILHEIEARLVDNSNIQEVRIVGADILHVDKNLRNEVWHGKNIFILAKTLKIYNNVTWNVSGKSSDHTYLNNAGTGEDGHGRQGADGYAGESGGNVLIEANEIWNPDHFTIISYGGKGSEGQDGGDGRVGEDGKGITRAEFEKKFPSVVKFFTNPRIRGKLFRQTAENIKESAKIKSDWSEDGNTYIRAVTNQGNEIIFSYFAATMFRRLFQAYLLYKGSLGQQGGRGGEYGLGGQGGYHGEIITNNPNIRVQGISGEKAEDGEKGNGGLHGNSGKNGWDMGYIDYQVWSQAKFYGRDESSRLQLQYHDSSWGHAPDDSVWCAYHNKYAQITATRVEHKKQKKYEERMETRRTNELQHQAKATKKKSIPRGKTLAEYSHCYSSLERNSFSNSQSGLDRIVQHALKAMVENAEQQEKVTTELKVKLHVKSTPRNGYMRRSKTAAATSAITFHDTTNHKSDIDSLIRDLTSEVELGEQSKLKTAEVNRSVLDGLFSTFVTLRSSSRENERVKNIEKDQVLNIEQLLNNKYRFAMLREIAPQVHVGDYNIIENNPLVTPECASRYLEVAEETDNNISHDILGTLNQYLYINGEEQHEKISKFIEEELQNSDDKPLKRSVRTFILKVAKSNLVHSDIKKYYLEYKEFLEKQVHSLKLFLEPFRNELERDKHLFDLWNKRDNNPSIQTELERELRKPKHKLLNALYKRFNNQLKQEYNWDKCCKNESLLKEYYDHLREMGPLSESYRELLAHVFDVNIRVYFKDRFNQLRIQDNHNPSSEQAIHILHQQNEFKQLNINENYLKLEKERAKMDDIYAKILGQTSALKEKQAMDDYFGKKMFANDKLQNDNPRQYSEGHSRESCDIISEFCMKELHSTNHKSLKQSISAFILEAGKSEKIHPDVQKYYNEFTEFSENRKRSLNIFFEPLYNELKHHKRAFALWRANKNDKSLKDQLEKEIRKDPFLNELYKRFDNQLTIKEEYNWYKCCDDEDFLNEYNAYIWKKSLPSRDRRELETKVTNQDNRLEKKHERQDNSYTHIAANNKPFELGKNSGYISEKPTGSLDTTLSDNEYLIVCEEQDILRIMKYFTCPEERLQIKQRLEKITCQYTGHSGIIQNIAERFSNDGRHVSFQELCCLVNSILTSVIERRKELNIFCWIIAAYPQTSWIDQLVLLQLENYFKKSLTEKSEWRGYLSKIDNKDILILFRSKLNLHKSSNPISLDCIEEILHSLSNIPDELVVLDGLDLPEWPYALKEKYWTHKLSKLEIWEESEKLSEASYYLLSTVNIFGPSLVEEFVETLIPLVERFRQTLETRASLPGILTEILNNFHTEKWVLSEVELTLLASSDIISWKSQMQQKFSADAKERDVSRLVKLIKGNKNTSKGILEKLTVIEKSIHSINKRENATDVQTTGRVGRFLEWIKPYTGTSTNDILGKLHANKNSINEIASMEVICDELDETEDFIQSIREQVRTTDGTTAGGMAENDIVTYSGLFRRCMESYQGENDEKAEFIEEARIGMLAVVNRAVELTRGFKLRDTQKLTVLILLTNESNTLAQVSTGEGKSLIVVAASIMKALCGEKVDIITSSSVLAKRDAEVNRDIYSLFGISVSHNCSEDIEQRKAAYSSSQVVYGDLSNFQRDYLLDRFYGRNMLGDRDCENVFVDEVDSMLLDKGNNMLYLSHDLAGLDKLESLYLYIWQRVNRPAGRREDFLSIFDNKRIKAAVLNDLYGVITKEDIKKLDFELDDQEAKIIWDRLVEAEILDDQGKLSTENIDETKLEGILSPKFSGYENRLYYLLKECIEREKFIRVPNYLKPFIEQHLEAWINSAIKASLMQGGHDYVTDVDRTGTSQDFNPNVTIVDRDTGTDQANSQWDEALHQFLQLKHGCKLSLQSLKAVFISNVSYFKLYSHLYGLTGTLGSQPERNLLKDVHTVDFVTIPTARSKQFIEEMPIFCTDKKEWFQKIYDETTALTGERNRSVLIICETIDDADTLYNDLVQRGTKNIHTYTRDYVEFDIAQGTKELESRQIIIATNLSGRGTDIKITEQLRKAGGLHVCLTYLPNNSRIEQQAFGRGARSGDKGSGRLIIMGSKGQDYSSSKILNLKKERDLEESYRISYIEDYYMTQIVTEEHYFKEFKKQYGLISEQLTKNDVSIEIKRILLQSCLDKWAFWLDRNSKRINNVTDEQHKRDFENSLSDFISQLKHLKTKGSENWSTWVDEQPIQMIELGKRFCQCKQYDVAIELFDKVIELEPCFSEAAHYYKSFALIKKIDWETKPLDKRAVKELKTHLRKAATIFDEHCIFSTRAAATINTIKRYAEKSIIQIDAYAEQQKSLSNLYSMFSQSVNNIFHQPMTPDSFVIGDINEELSEIIYEDLLRTGILKKLKVKDNIPEEALNRISLEYRLSIDELNACLSPFKGKDINEKEFLKMLNTSIKLPSREDFWKLLIQENILNQEVQCIIVDLEKLQKVDPSLVRSLRAKIDKKELKEESLECQVQKEIILNVEQAIADKDSKMPKKDCMILEKGKLQEVINNDEKKYSFLKEKGVFSFNKKARIDLRKIVSTTLPRYDSITLDDFSRKNFSTNDAKQILAELVEQKVLKQENSENGIYRLIIPFSKIDKTYLSRYPVYRNAVIELLSQCFIYRLTLEKIKNELKRKVSPIYLRLPGKPHRSIFCELIDQGIVRSVRVSMEIKELEQKLKRMYSRTITKDNLKLLISQSTLISEENNTDELCNHLVEKEWLVCQKSKKPRRDHQLHELIEEIKSAFNPGEKYSINDSGKRVPLSTYEDIQETIAQILDHRLKLAEEGTIKDIVRILEQSRSPLKTLKVPDSSLKPITECDGLRGSKYMEEVNIFILNGLDQLIQLEERKWTRSMIFNTAIVVAMGISQIAIGAVMEVYSAGVMTHAATSCISEGISDIIFAISSYGSGHFSWKDYRQHKVQSLMLTTVTCGIGAYLSRGAKVSRFGSEMVGNSLNIGEKAAEMTGSRLINAMEATGGLKVAGNYIIRKTMNAAAFGLAQTGVDVVVRNYLKKLCDGIGAAVLSVVTNTVNESNLFAALERTYLTLGKERATKLSSDLIRNFFNEPSVVEKYIAAFFKTAHSVTQGIALGVKKMSESGKNMYATLGQVISAVIALLPAVEHLVHVGAIRNITGSLVDNFEKILSQELNNITLANNSRQDVPQQIQGEDCESFKTEVIDQLNSLLCDKVGRVVEQHIVKPILNEGAGGLMGYCERIIRMRCQSQEDNINNERLDELKRQYRESEQIAPAPVATDHEKVEGSTVDEYHENLNTLMTNTRDHKLLAAVARENAPIDVTCLDVCTQVLRKVSKTTQLTIVAKEEGGNGQKFSSSVGVVAEEQVIELELINNRFKLHGNQVRGESGGNCLYEAVSKHLNLNMTRESFRAEMAYYIEHDPDVQYCIRRNWHSVSTSYREFSGRHGIRMVYDKRGAIDKKVIVPRRSMDDHTISGNGAPDRHVRILEQNVSNSWQGESFTTEETADGYFFLHNSRSVGAAFTRTPTQLVRLMAYEESGEFLSAGRTSRCETLLPGQAFDPQMEHGKSRRLGRGRYESHYEYSRQTKQQIRKSNVELYGSPKTRQPAIRRSNSAERPFS